LRQRRRAKTLSYNLTHDGKSPGFAGEYLLVKGEKMDSDMKIEALVALVEKRDREIKELADDNERYFYLWTEIVAFIGQEQGRDEIYRIARSAIKNQEYLDRLLIYIEENT
jgi:hypothetical protein